MVFLENRHFFMDKLHLKMNFKGKIETIWEQITDIFINYQIIR